jgi:hypothetical protein
MPGFWPRSLRYLRQGPKPGDPPQFVTAQLDRLHLGAGDTNLPEVFYFVRLRTSVTVKQKSSVIDKKSFPQTHLALSQPAGVTAGPAAAVEIQTLPCYFLPEPIRSPGCWQERDRRGILSLDILRSAEKLLILRATAGTSLFE